MLPGFISCKINYEESMFVHNITLEIQKVPDQVITLFVLTLIYNLNNVKGVYMGMLTLLSLKYQSCGIEKGQNVKPLRYT